MKKIIRNIKICIVTLIYSLAVIAPAVGELEEVGYADAENNVAVWTATGTEKIFKESDYSARYGNKTLEIKAFRNEYESAQIVISPSTSAKYQIETADLTSSAGETLSADAFSVYHEKYVYVSSAKETNSIAGVGYYPDALLPYETAVEYGENSIEAGDNQAVWITLKVPKEQTAGNYSGNFKVTVGKATCTVPVSITVYDYTLSDTTHVKSKFMCTDTDIGVMELDDTPEMSEAYYEFLLDYRLTGTYMPYGRVWSNDREKFFEYVVKYTQDERCSVVQIPWIGGSTTVELNSNGLLAIDDERGQSGNTTTTLSTVSWSHFEDMLFQFLEQSLSNELNLFKKTSVYVYIFDEFDSTGNGYIGQNKAQYSLRRIQDCVTVMSELVESLEWSEKGVVQTKTLAFDSEEDNGGLGGYYLKNSSSTVYGYKGTKQEFEALRAEMAESVAKVRNTTTCTKVTELMYNTTSFAFCPTIDYYNMEGNRTYAEQFAEQSDAEMWTYTAVNPMNPNPTYHIEDNLLSSRLLGWMMYEYNIVGNLYWETVLSRYTNKNLSDCQISSQDYYNDPLRFSGANGDGYLLYPGRPYGIYGPVASIRLHSLRDGNEDYDLLYELEEYYKAQNVSGDDFESVMALLAKNLYSGTECNYEAGYLDNFAACREKLADLLVLTSKTGVIVEKYALDSVNAVFTFSAPEGLKVTVNGQTLSGTNKDGRTRYSYSLALNKGTNEFALSAEKDGKTYGVEFSVSDASLVAASEKASDFEITTNIDHTAGISTKTLDGKTVLESKFSAADKTIAQIQMNISSLNLDKTYGKVSFEIYYNEEEEAVLTFKTKASDGKAYLTVSNATLQKGWNTVTLNLGQCGLNAGGTLSYVRMAISRADGEAWGKEFAVSIGNIVVYKK